MDVDVALNSAAYSSKTKLTKVGMRATWEETGVKPSRRAMVEGAQWMLITMFPYLLIQGAAFAYRDETDEKTRSRSEVGGDCLFGESDDY